MYTIHSHVYIYIYVHSLMFYIFMYVQYVFTLYIYDIYIDAQWLLDESSIHFFGISGIMYHLFCRVSTLWLTMVYARVLSTHDWKQHFLTFRWCKMLKSPWRHWLLEATGASKLPMILHQALPSATWEMDGQRCEFWWTSLGKLPSAYLT